MDWPAAVVEVTAREDTAEEYGNLGNPQGQCIPDDLVIDTRVFMRDNVAHTFDPAPFYLRLISNEFLAEPGHRFADPVRNGFGREPQCLILVVCGAAPGH